MQGGILERERWFCGYIIQKSSGYFWENLSRIPQTDDQQKVSKVVLNEISLKQLLKQESCNAFYGT